MDVDTNEAEKLGLDFNIFNVVASKGSAGQNIGLNQSGYIAVYSVRASGEGNELLVSITDEYIITGIKITFGSKDGESDGKLILGTLGPEYFKSSKNGTIIKEDLNINSFFIKNVHTGGSSNLQIHIFSIEITFEPVNP